MALSKLPQKRSDGIEFIDTRTSLFYSKYRYRARIYIEGITATWWAKDETDLDSIIKRRRWKNVDKNLILNYLKWTEALPPKNKTYTIRLEGDVGAIFSNDLDFLKTLETIGAEVDYTEVDESVPVGVKYFVKEPKHKYRFYLKSKRVKDTFAKDLKAFIKRYENTGTVFEPSPALRVWLRREGQSTYSWMHHYCSSSYFIDYDDESSLTLFVLLFDGMISKKYKLEKRPE